MAGLAHAGVGLAAKRVTPKVPLIALLVAAYAIDFIWGIFFLTGLEGSSQSGQESPSYWSHSLFMALVWSVLIGVAVMLVSRNRSTALMIGILVFSHWAVDFISHPMTAVFPDDTGLPLLFSETPLVGLGVWRTQLGVNIGEYGTFIVGLIIYLLTLRNLRKDKHTAAQQSDKSITQRINCEG